MYAYGLFSCNAEILHTSPSIWIKRNFIEKKHFKKHLLLNFIINSTKLLYFPWYPDAFFPPVTFHLLAPVLKNCPLKKVFRGHFGSQVKFSGWNTVYQSASASGAVEDWVSSRENNATTKGFHPHLVGSRGTMQACRGQQYQLHFEWNKLSSFEKAYILATKFVLVATIVQKEMPKGDFWKPWAWSNVPSHLDLMCALIASKLISHSK